jgi:hypothetical protein
MVFSASSSGALLKRPDRFIDHWGQSTWGAQVTFPVQQSASGGTDALIEELRTLTRTEHARGGARALGALNVRGEPFDIVLENGEIYLKHSRWSIFGSGKLLFDAELDLLAEAREVLPLFAAMDPTGMSGDALEFREFLYRVASS